MSPLNHFTFTIANPDHDTLAKLRAFKHHPSTADLKAKIQSNFHGKLYITGQLLTPLNAITLRRTLQIPRLYLKQQKINTLTTNPTPKPPTIANPLTTWLKSFPSVKSILSHTLKSIIDNAPPTATNTSK